MRHDRDRLLFRQIQLLDQALANTPAHAVTEEVRGCVGDELLEERAADWLPQEGGQRQHLLAGAAQRRVGLRDAEVAEQRERKRLRVLPPAFEARSMACGEGSRLVEKEQFGVAAAPDLAMTILEFQPAANPLP